MALTDKEELFCQSIAELGEKHKVVAYERAGYSMKMSQPAICVQADKIFNKPKINLRIKELKKVTDKVAKERFTITVERRIEWLRDIIEAGLDTYEDGNGQKRRENLSASKGAIETLNSMLGKDDGEDDAKELTITFGVNSPVGEIKVTRGDGK